MFLCLYLCLHWDRESCGNWSVRNFGKHPAGGWLLFESPWRSEECSPPQESSYEAPHQPPGTIIAHSQRKVWREKVTAGHGVNIHNLQFPPQVSAAQCMFGQAVGKVCRGQNKETANWVTVIIVISKYVLRGFMHFGFNATIYLS